MRSLCLAICAAFSAGAFGQTADISGWSELPWGASKSSVLKSRLAPRECSAKDAACPGPDALVIGKYDFTGVSFTVYLQFAANNGLSKVTMFAEDKRGAFEKILSTLTARYGKPGLQSEYDGAQERTYTSWIWAKPKGKLSLESDEDSGVFTLTYEAWR